MSPDVGARVATSKTMMDAVAEVIAALGKNGIDRIVVAGYANPLDATPGIRVMCICAEPQRINETLRQFDCTEIIAKLETDPDPCLTSLELTGQGMTVAGPTFIAIEMMGHEHPDSNPDSGSSLK